MRNNKNNNDGDDDDDESSYADSEELEDVETGGNAADGRARRGGFWPMLYCQ